MDLQKINELTQKYVDGTATEAEKEQLNEWFREKTYRDAIFPDDDGATYHSMLQHINDAIKPPKRAHGHRVWILAASVAIFLGISVYLFIPDSEVSAKHDIATHKNDIIPGGNKAILTLANGSRISLTDANNGKVASQGGVQISKTANGQLIYAITTPSEQSTSIAQDKDTGVMTYNTIETPIGGQYQVLLPDGSKVWLNALSSIKFPVSFARLKERKVELTGEAYFDVKHSKDNPFIVVTRGQITEDIGTEFNINAYPEDISIKTTLVKGSVRILSSNQSIMLKPGEQSDLSTRIKVTSANIDGVVAWKDGYFKFDDDSLEDIMKQVARWYTVKVVFKDQSLKSESYGAVIRRTSNISSLINLMQQAGNANFVIEANTIVISRKKKNL